MARRAPHRLAARLAIVVAVIAFLVFLPSLVDGFVFDDTTLIPQNEYVHALTWLPRAFETHLWDVSPRAFAGAVDRGDVTMLHYYRPLITVSNLLTWVLVGRAPWAFHLTNVIAHALTVLLATRAATRWTRSAALGTAIGIIFALHPTRGENVLWISGRMDIFMLLFGLAALEAFRRFERTRERAAFGTGLLFLVLALLSKEPAVMFPLVLLAERPRSKQPFIVTTALCVVYAIGRSILLPPSGDTVQRAFTPKAFLVTVEAYFQRAVVPWPPAMYFEPEASWPILAIGVAIIAATIALLVFAWRRSRPAFWVLAAAIAFIAPLLNVFFLGLKEQAQDRFLYAPLFFALCGGAILVKKTLQRLVRRRSTWIAGGGLALAAIALLELRTLDYKDDVTFWTAELAHNPTDPYVLRMNGITAASMGDLTTALSFYERADKPESQRLQNTTEHAAAHFEEAGLRAALMPDGRFDDLRALELELARTLDPSRVPSPRKVDGFPVGEPLPGLRANGRFVWDVALLATRVGDDTRADDAIRNDASHTASSPRNGVLVLARLDRMTEARALLKQLHEGQTLTGSDAQLSARLDRAANITKTRDAANGPERNAYEALRLADLGAYWSALRVLAAADLVEAPPTVDLTLQLLVACRLDAAARTFAARHGTDASVTGMMEALPPSVRAQAPVASTLEHVLTAAARPLHAGAFAPGPR